MKHITIDYGIDLGTTNSAIARMERGEANIIRSDIGSETTPSCVAFKKSGALSVGASAYADLGRARQRALKKGMEILDNSCTEFKRFMGTDKIYCGSYMQRQYTPEELSARVLETLCSFVCDEEVDAAVITVPAKFTVNQKDATLHAARLAGLNQVELLQEPIAASIAYGLTAGADDGIWMVFDFGGGTLDVALVHVCDGVMQVFDTEGDNYLGGKNIDEAIVSHILLPRLLSKFVIDLTDKQHYALLTDALKVLAERLKIELTYKEEGSITLEGGDWGEDEEGEEIEMEICVTRRELEEAILPVLQKAVDVCRTLMIRNELSPDALSKLILIGGPTYIPMLRSMLREQVTPNVDTSVDPMTAVARGAAIYAATVPTAIKNSSDNKTGHDTLELEVDFESTCADTLTYLTVKTADPEEGLQVRITRTEDGWESAPATITQRGGLIEAELLPRRPNRFKLTATVHGKACDCFPSEITIVSGVKTGSAILPYNIGIEVYNPKKQRRMFTSLTGLEKNRLLPASGTAYGLKTMNDLYGGDENSRIRIAIFQGDNEAEGKTAALFEYVSDIEVTGDDIVSFIPKGSMVNVRVDVDRSEMMTVTCEFPDTDEKIVKRLDTSKRQESKSVEYLADMISQIRLRISDMESDQDMEEISRLNTRLRQVEETLHDGAQHKQIEQHLKELMRSIEGLEDSTAWDKAKYLLKSALLKLQIEGDKHADPLVTGMIDNFKAQTERILQLQDKEKADYLKNQIDDYYYKLRQAEIYRNVINWAYNEFSTIRWTNAKTAQKLVNAAKKVIDNNPDAPLSETGELTEAFYAMIIKEDKDEGRGRFGAPDSGINILSI